MWHLEFILAAVLVIGAGLDVSLSRRRLRNVPNPSGLPGRGLPLLDTAFLAGGPARVADTVIVRMQQEGRLVVSRSRQVTVTDGTPRDEIEAVLIGTAGPGRRERLDVLRTKVMASAHVQRIGDQLADRGLMRRPELIQRVKTARYVLLAALAVTLVLGIVAQNVAFLGLLLVGLAWYVATRPGAQRITPAGLRQLSLMREGASPWSPSLSLTGGGALAAVAAADAVALGAMALDGPVSLTDEDLRAALLAQTARQHAAVGHGSSGGDSGASGAWCGGASGGGVSCGAGSSPSPSHSSHSHSHSPSSSSSSSHDSGSSSHSSHSSHSCGSSSHSSHSCGGHSCGGHSSCGSSCGS